MNRTEKPRASVRRLVACSLAAGAVVLTFRLAAAPTTSAAGTPTLLRDCPIFGVTDAGWSVTSSRCGLGT